MRDYFCGSRERLQMVTVTEESLHVKQETLFQSSSNKYTCFRNAN